MADPSPRARPISTFESNGNAQEPASYRTSSDWTRSAEWGAPGNPVSGPSQPFRHEPGSRPSSSGLDKAVKPIQSQTNPSTSTSSSPRSSFMVLNNGQSSRMGSASPAASPVASRRVTPQTSCKSSRTRSRLYVAFIERLSLTHLLYFPATSLWPASWRRNAVLDTLKALQRKLDVSCDRWPDTGLGRISYDGLYSKSSLSNGRPATIKASSSIVWLEPSPNVPLRIFCRCLCTPSSALSAESSRRHQLRHWFRRPRRCRRNR